MEVPLDQIQYVDHPELKISKHESIQMPFRYMKNQNGDIIMPKVGDLMSNMTFAKRRSKGMLDLIKKDSEKGFGDLF